MIEEPIVQTITLEAGAVSQIYQGVFNSYFIKPTNSLTTYKDLEIKLDSLNFVRVVPSIGISFKEMINDEGDSRDAVFKSVQFKNNSQSVYTFEIMLFFGSSFDNSNLTVSGEMSVENVGTLSPKLIEVRDDIESTHNVSTLCKSLFLFNDGDYVIEIFNHSATLKIMELDPKCFIDFPIHSQSLSFRAIGGISNLCATELRRD